MRKLGPLGLPLSRRGAFPQQGKSLWPGAAFLWLLCCPDGPFRIEEPIPQLLGVSRSGGEPLVVSLLCGSHLALGQAPHLDIHVQRLVGMCVGATCTTPKGPLSVRASHRHSPVQLLRQPRLSPSVPQQVWPPSSQEHSPRSSRALVSVWVSSRGAQSAAHRMEFTTLVTVAPFHTLLYVVWLSLLITARLTHACQTRLQTSY